MKMINRIVFVGTHVMSALRIAKTATAMDSTQNSTCNEH